MAWNGLSSAYGYGYGDQQAAPVQYTVAAQDPVLPTATASYNPITFNTKIFRCYGVLLAIMAAVTLALGIADVVITLQAYCGAGTSCAGTSAEPYVWVWVASGIWASVPLFLAGIFGVIVSRDPYRWTRCFVAFIFLSAIVFAPAMVVLSSIEAWRGSASTNTFYTSGGAAAGTITASPNPYQAKYGIPVAIAVLGGIMFLMTAALTIALCCCMHRLGIYLRGEIGLYNGSSTQTVVQQPVYQQQAVLPPVVQSNDYYYPSPPPRPQIRGPQINQYAVEYNTQVNPSSFDPYSRGVPNLPTRYNNVPYGGAGFGSAGFLYGNGPSRQMPGFVNGFASDVFAQGNNVRLPPMGYRGFASDFFKPNGAYFWQ